MKETTQSPRVPYATLVVQFAASRFAILLVASFAILILQAPGPAAWHHGHFWNWFFRWDSIWFVDVAQHGYSFSPDRQSNVVFLPLFPVAMRFVSEISGLPLFAAGYLVANLCFLAAAVALWRLVYHETNARAAADWATAFLFFGPVSFFFSLVYSEALFLLLLVLTLYHARRGGWLLAALCGYGAALTRSVGVLLAVPLLVEFLHQEGWKFPGASKTAWLKLAACGGPPLGTLSYVSYLGWATHEPLAYMKAEVFWNRHFTWLWETFAHLRWFSAFYQAFWVGTLATIVILLAFGVWLRLRPSLLVACIVYFFIYTQVTTLEAIPRYFSVVAPLYLIAGIGAARIPAIAAPLLGLSSAVLAFSTVMFVGGYWFT